MSAYAPYNLSYAQSASYLTTAEYVSAPTAIDTSNLVTGSGAGSQTTSLYEVIGRASSLIDGECMGAWGTLNATVNVENGRIWGNRKGQLVVNPKYWPILEVDAFSYGWNPRNSASVVCESTVEVYPRQFIVSPGAGTVGLGFNSLGGSGVGQCEYSCVWSYVNGWPNTALAASVAAGATSIMPANVTGIYPGTNLTVFDAPNDEQITVALSYVPGAAVVPLVSPLLYQHLATVTITNLPKAVKQAAISLTTFLIKNRGSGALVVNDMGAVTKMAQNGAQGSMDDYNNAMAAMRHLKSMWAGY